MSVNIVKKELIDILVTALVPGAEKLPKAGHSIIIGGMPKAEQDRVRKQCNDIGEMLWGVNYDSYNRRYSGDNEDSRMPEYVFEPDHRMPLTVLACVELYEAEISESPEVDARATCDVLRRRLVHKLPAIEEEIKKVRHLR